MRPSFHLETAKAKNEASDHQSKVVPQTWQKSGRCPNGTIPIRRIRREDLLRASSLENFGKKAPPPPPVSSHKNNATYHLPNELVNISSTNISFLALPDRSVSELKVISCVFFFMLGRK